jgi:WD40 repeat-containing protein SMU1
VSPKGEWVYGVGENNVLYCFKSQTAELHSTLEVHSKNTLGVVHHPHRNLLATVGDGVAVRLWKP